MNIVFKLYKPFFLKNFLFTGSAIAAVLVPMPGHATWAPKPEPSFWSEVRVQLAKNGNIQDANWTFMEALQSPKIEAAEYLRDPRRSEEVVSFKALLLMRQGQKSSWEVRQISMRAQCSDGVLERQDQQGQWLEYPGRKGTASKVSWICAQAPKP